MKSDQVSELKQGRILTLFLMFAMLFAWHSSALDPGRDLLQYNLQKWGTGDGLPQNSIQALLQSQKGFLWIGTQEGLCRFDGVRFVVFDSNNTPDLARSDVRALIEASDGTLWAGTYGGGLFNMNGGETGGYSQADGLAGDSVTCLAEDSTNRICIGTETGLSIIDGDVIRSFAPTDDGLPSDFITSLCAEPDGMLWLGTDKGMIRFDGNHFSSVDLPDKLGVSVLSKKKRR